MSKYKIIMTGGGTAGHVTPNLALIPKLKEKGFEIKYIGSFNGIEKEIIEKNNIPFFGISCGKLRRYFDVKNFTDPFKIMKGVIQSIRIISKEQPDIVFSKGGFVAVPVVIAASMKKIPVVAHESDITPGLANKLSAPFCDKLCVTFRESLNYVKGDKGVLTGSPIREEILKGDKFKGKKLCGFTNDKETLLIMGGSLGSKLINEEIRKNLDRLLSEFNIIHICGKGNIEESLKDRSGYQQFEYVSDELPNLMAAADYIVSRAGANSIFEFLALKKPTLLIPLSKKASRGDQILNSKSFKKEGYSLMIEEEEINEKVLYEKIIELKKRKRELIGNMEKSQAQNGVEAIVGVLLKSIGE
ncbi:UDP-N-acetylglucosamine--N-acetylmuramyl-(pentapeptide) pyrophosphoryl-undecaprenol N-acetylglucosamine transferase [Clostridium saccharoperbutylacetonicum]|uniref:UDP-N-acetylglucosamine--N-acetylmuramyl-(pentapeptide) pyrophosphoryl-undecaprenol N-acetylglucosamine transferase n=1 Tax=Clostridium saccharoperbutylacetonicum N1-4(HMT) TaxID=931276 RepID=M1MKA6_9CLOT|nr:undecaprenyldiphospho-muramoylpentapeptide beta-N-acetylglucosaminyltransferase [Clostridium saccharoperbutylacetonicum]AGF58354.1 UDP-N-acetylglucosamine--N-acetylmuramyl-(pentapeptide) pyrophosphoryl-undecaprenol N-acetylglucosamine transferase MurG [Clostridium saccharoperbutylacetonicum N1-4(HMT)]NRT60868.1 UDP-N-acetylglucosamine--N-acetylmuramyl-(pentapeptide) pyrophosphoryl-undecaprenol N-acetylglucosamine transferase [Clostridium saccharoperbutylacetonicum]NSB24182.1 UDP-N-acetylgluco